MKENEKTVNQFGKNVKHQRIFVVNDPTMCRIIPSLAMEIGLNESILFMQLEFWISITPDDDTHVRDGKKWIWKSVRDMQDEVFPFWSIDKINRIVNNLLKQKLIFVNTSYNKFSYDKTRWFAINFDTVSKLNSLKVNDFTPTLSQNKTPLYGNADEQNQDVTSTLSQNRTGVSQNKTTIPETTTRDKNNDDSKDLNFLSDDAGVVVVVPSGNENAGNTGNAFDELIKMIPEKMRVPVVKNLVASALKEKGLCFVRDAIAYTNDRKKVVGKDTWQAYRTYLDKSLNGEYGGVSGFFESCQSASGAVTGEVGKKGIDIPGSQSALGFLSNGKVKIGDVIEWNGHKSVVTASGSRFKMWNGSFHDVPLSEIVKLFSDSDAPIRVCVPGTMPDEEIESVPDIKFESSPTDPPKVREKAVPKKAVPMNLSPRGRARNSQKAPDKALDKAPASDTNHGSRQRSREEQLEALRKLVEAERKDAERKNGTE